MNIQGFEIGKQEVSIALIILFAMVAMFFLGYKLAYDKAINYANIKVEMMVAEFKYDMSLTIPENTDFIIGNIDIGDMGVEEE